MRHTSSLLTCILLGSWIEPACAADVPIDYPARPVLVERSTNRALAMDSNRPPSPPPEAYSACSGHSEGDTCSVKFQDQTLDGTCRKFPGADGLVCVPAHMPPPPGR